MPVPVAVSLGDGPVYAVGARLHRDGGAHRAVLALREGRRADGDSRRLTLRAAPFVADCGGMRAREEPGAPVALPGGAPGRRVHLDVIKVAVVAGVIFGHAWAGYDALGGWAYTD